MLHAKEFSELRELSISYPHLLEVLLNLRGELNSLLVQISKFHVDVAHRLLEVEILIDLARCDPDIASRGQAPVSRSDVGPADELHQSRHVDKLALWESIEQPCRLAMEIVDVIELVVGLFARGLEIFKEFGEPAPVEDEVPVVAFLVLQLLV